MGFARSVMTIAAKDLRAELRTKEAINASLSFALVILLLHGRRPMATAPGSLDAQD